MSTSSSAISSPSQLEAPLVAPPPREARSGRRKLTPARVAQYVLLALLAAIVLYPMVWLFISTFKPSSEFGQNPGLLPENGTIDNYFKVLEGIGGIPLWKFFANSLLLAVAAVVGTLASSSLAAYAFARIRFRGAGIFFAAMIGTLLLPFHVIIIPQYVMFQRLDLVDTFWPLIIPKFLATEAFFVFLIVQFIRNIPRDMDEAARIDGAGHLRTFFSVILPLIKPALITSAIFTFIWTWNDFLGPLLYLNSPENYPLPIALRLYNDQTSVSDYGATVAVSFLALLPVLLFFLVFQRFLVDGVATQGLKG